MYEELFTSTIKRIGEYSTKTVDRGMETGLLTQKRFTRHLDRTDVQWITIDRMFWCRQFNRVGNNHGNEKSNCRHSFPQRWGKFLRLTSYMTIFTDLLSMIFVGAGCPTKGLDLRITIPKRTALLDWRYRSLLHMANKHEISVVWSYWSKRSACEWWR